jgi:UDP-N-acetylmuramate--alanine ligase
VTDILERPDAVGFTVTGGPTGSHRLIVGSLLGRHMALNAAGAFTLGMLLGFDPTRIADVWREFQGVHRRFEFRGEAGGVRVYDDYAHHPTEVRAALSAARSALAPNGRLIAVFQPGTYSRTQTFAAEFGAAMAVADVAVVMDIFPAREEPIPGVTGALIAAEVPLPPEAVHYEPSWTATAPFVAALARPGDVVITMGIGDVHLLCPEILTDIGRRTAGTAAS